MSARESDTELLELVRESVLVRGLDGRILYWNAACERLYGWNMNAALGQTVDKLLRTTRSQAADVEVALAKEGKWHGDVMRRNAAGTALTVSLQCVLRHDPSGAPQDVVETGIDITPQRLAQEALKQAENRYYNVFQAMAVSFWELDFNQVGAMVNRLRRDGVTDLSAYFRAHPDFVRKMIRATQVVDVNDQSVLLFGKGDKQKMLDSLEPYWPEASQNVYAESVAAAAAGLPQYATETRLRALDGREFDVWFTACFPPRMMLRGKLLIGIIDISADRKARSDLRASEFRYRSLFHFLPVAMVQLDRSELAGVFEKMQQDGVTDLLAYFEANPDFYPYAARSIKVAEANQRAVELFGAPNAAALLGPASRIWSEASETIKRAMAARYDGASRFEAEMKVRTYDGELRDVLYVAYFPEAFKEGALGLSCLVDISDRVKAQGMLTQLQSEFAHAARVSLLGELTASIAHEINQPLGAILTSGEAALRWLARPEPDLDELRALSGRTIADARRAADIIQRIRAIAVRGQPEQVVVALNAVVEEVMLFLRPELLRQDVETVLELAPGLPDVLGDRVQLQQVFVNLAVNAMQAMAAVDPTRRRLTIRTELDARRGVRAEIEDNGPGIAADHLERLFDSFFSTKKGGMGIGLAVCRSIIEAHGGRIEAANLPGGAGARFRFTLPTVPHTQV